MKKTYNVPKVKVTKIQTFHMLANSIQKFASGSDGSVFSKEDNDWWDDED